MSFEYLQLNHEESTSMILLDDGLIDELKDLFSVGLLRIMSGVSNSARPSVCRRFEASSLGQDRVINRRLELMATSRHAAIYRYHCGYQNINGAVSSEFEANSKCPPSALFQMYNHSLMQLSELSLPMSTLPILTRANLKS